MSEDRILDVVFGPDATAGRSVPERALFSETVFVRGLDMLTIERSDRPTGRRLSAREALDAYGLDKLVEVASEGSAIITSSTKAAGNALRTRRETLGLSVKSVAGRSQLSKAVVESLERSERRPVQEYESVARVLGLDEREISFLELPSQNEEVAVRLRTMSRNDGALTNSTVANLSEASWVAMTQRRLEASLGLNGSPPHFAVSSDFGGPGKPPYGVGYDLANEVRRKLGIGVEPIASLRDLVEETLKIPVIQTDLGPQIAGATVASGPDRAIVLNVQGLNSQAVVRRSTLAHELCHLLFDPTEDLNSLTVDNYDEISQPAEIRTDAVEQRANAFAIQLLAPQQEALVRFELSDRDLFSSVLDHFGVSFTAGRYQIWNALQQSEPIDTITGSKTQAEADWDARETYTLAYHPISQLLDRPSRAGKFSAVAVRAGQVGLVSWDTVAEWLGCSAHEASESRIALSGLYPSVFGTV